MSASGAIGPSARQVDLLQDPFAVLQATIFPELALTAYLPRTASPIFDAGYHAAAFAELAHQVENRLGEPEAAALRRELPAVVAYLDTNKPPQQMPIAILACRPAGLLDAWRLRDDVELELRIAHRLELQPIRWQLQAHPPVLVVAADKEKVTVYAVVLEHVEEVAAFAGRDVHVQRQGGSSAVSWQRKEEGHARENLLLAADWLRRVPPGFVGRLYLAGPAEARELFRSVLPPAWSGLVAGELRLPLYASHGEIANSVRNLG
ncbi:MAG TPA: hypothetical protein VNG93_12485 [Candidatus Dormibacteraeota bacterium]|nr:hypothetical protein [Candidatus Dormibacteraeota bacterium]